MSYMGINNYGGNSFYSSIYSGLYSNKNKYNYNNAADLQSLMKLADEVRSPAYAKKMKESFSSSSSGSSEVGTVASEANLSKTAGELQKAAASLTDISRNDIADSDSLYKKVSDFADKYNSVIDAMGKSDSVDALRAGLEMTNSMKTYSGALKRVGITVGSDNKLTVNENTLKNADKNAVASLLTNNYSPVARIANKAETVSKAAANKAQTTAFRNMAYGQSNKNSLYGNSYNAYSGYNNYASSFIGSLFNSLG